MKSPYSILIAVLFLMSGLCSAQTTPPTTLSKAKTVIASLKVELLGTQAELVDSKKNLGDALFNLDSTQKIVLNLQTQIDALGKDRDLGWQTANDRLTTINKQADKITKMQIRVAEVAIGVGVLCGLVTVLSILYFLGSKAWTSGPYGFAAIAAAALVAWIAGFAFVERFFNT